MKYEWFLVVDYYSKPEHNATKSNSRKKTRSIDAKFNNSETPIFSDSPREALHF